MVNACDNRELMSTKIRDKRDINFAEVRENLDMRNTRDDLRDWLQHQLDRDGRGAKAKLAEYLGVGADVITRMLNKDPTKESREIKGSEVIRMAKFFGVNLPSFIDPVDDTRTGHGSTSFISSFDPDEDQGYGDGIWTPKVAGSLPEVDVRLGAGEGNVGDMVSLPVGAHSYSAHKVVAEWLLSPTFLREAKASQSETVVMEVIGDSMQPSYMPGDRVLVDISQRNMITDTVYAISDGYTEPQIKRLQRVPFSDPPLVRIISDNPNLEAFTVELSRLTIVGRICGHIARR